MSGTKIGVTEGGRVYGWIKTMHCSDTRKKRDVAGCERTLFGKRKNAKDISTSGLIAFGLSENHLWSADMPQDKCPKLMPLWSMRMERCMNIIRQRFGLQIGMSLEKY